MKNFLLRDDFASVLARRGLTVGGYTLATLLVLATLPLLVLLSLIWDAARIVRASRRLRARDPTREPRSAAPPGTWSGTRTLLFLTSYLVCELIGVVVAFALWIGLPLLGRERFLRANFALQCRWGSSLFKIGGWLFDFQTVVHGHECLERDRPILLMLRHSSMADTVLAVRFVSAPHDIQLRYVLKRPLLFDPCLDIVGNRLPNWFSTHASPRRQRELDGIAALADDLSARDGVLIYPEGTRFSPQKKALQLRRVEQRSSPEVQEVARSLRHVLLPREGGPIALLRKIRGSDSPVDVVFCSHTGFEGSATFADLVSGQLVGRTIQLCFWRVAHEDIPASPADVDEHADGASHERALYEWLLVQWQKVDAFIDQHTATG